MEKYKSFQHLEMLRDASSSINCAIDNIVESSEYTNKICSIITEEIGPCGDICEKAIEYLVAIKKFAEELKSIPQELEQLALKIEDSSKTGPLKM